MIGMIDGKMSWYMQRDEDRCETVCLPVLKRQISHPSPALVAYEVNMLPNAAGLCCDKTREMGTSSVNASLFVPNWLHRSHIAAFSKVNRAE